MHERKEGSAISQAWLERLSAWQIAGFGSAVVVSCGLGIVMAAPVAVDAFFGGLGSLVAIGSLWAVAAQRRLASLPLELGDAVLLQERDGDSVAHVRVRLGLGRVVREPRVTASWHTPEGETPVEAVVPLDVLCGAWSVLVPIGDGELDLEVVVTEGDRRWTAQRRWAKADIRSGRFTSGFVLSRGRVRVDHSAWSSEREDAASH